MKLILSNTLLPIGKKTLRKCSDWENGVTETLTWQELMLSGSMEDNWRNFKQGFVVFQQILGAKEKEEPGLL